MLPDTVKTKAQCFLTATLSIKVGTPGLTCFLFEGSMETHCDYATWSVSAEVSMSGTEEKQRKGEGDLKERLTISSYTLTVLLMETIVLFHQY